MQIGLSIFKLSCEKDNVLNRQQKKTLRDNLLPGVYFEKAE